jgi:N-alpha-acetyltransferase 50
MTTNKDLRIQSNTSPILRSVQKKERRDWANTNRSIPTFLIPEPHVTNEPAFILPNCPSITINQIQQEHLPALKRLTSTLLPAKYPDPFYTDAITDPSASTLSRIALYHPPDSFSAPKPVGWIRSSLEPDLSPQPTTTTTTSSETSAIHNQIYIKTLCLLAPYRHLGVATALLNCVLKQEELLRKYDVQSVSAHVWETNEDALEWYEKRGFEREEFVPGYYRRLRPGGAWVVRRRLSWE